MKKIIIFGATGHVGSYMTLYAKNYFAPNEFEIVASGRRSTANCFKDMGVEYVSVDITKESDFSKLPSSDVYAVILLAAQIPAYMDGYKPKQYLDSIIYGTYNVLEYCRSLNVDRILFSTSCFDVWEYPKDMVIKPDVPLNFSYTGDHAMYVISKNAAIELLKHYHQQYGLKVFVFRFPTIYSYSSNHYYYPNGIKTLRPLYRMISLAQEGKNIECWGNPNYSKDMIHVYDASQMFCKAIQSNIDYGFYNCGTGIPVTMEEQIKAIIKVFSPKGKSSKIVYRPDLKSGGGILMDVANAKRELGYIPQYDVYALFEDFKKEMEIDRFKELRG